MKTLLSLFLCIFVTFGFADTASLSPENPYQIHAIISSETSATISSPMAGLVDNLFIKEGSTFKKDSVLLQFDCRTQLANLQKAQADLNFAQINRDSYTKLSNLGAASAMKVAESKANFEKSQADLKIAQKEVSDCEIKAPYDGQVTELYVHQNESVQLYQKLFDIFDNKALVAEVLVPSDWLAWLKQGSTFQLAVDETNKTYTVTVNRIIQEVDAVSRSVKVIGIFSNIPDDVQAGMSGDATFQGPKK